MDRTGLKLQGTGRSNYIPGPGGMGIDSSHQDISNEGSIISLSSLKLVFFKLFKHGHFLINYRFRLLGVELSIALSLLNFLQGKGKKISDWVMPLGFYMHGEVISQFFQKSIGSH